MNCKYCKEWFEQKSHKQKFCSRTCATSNKIGKKNWWGHKISKALKGKPKTPEHRLKVIKANTGQVREKIRGKNHPHWKGNNAGYCAVHDWVKRRIPKGKNCVDCLEPDRKILKSNNQITSYLHLANISGTYKRNVSDWKYLCPRCHSRLDKGRSSISKQFVDLLRK